MSESLIIKDGSGIVRNLQVDSGSSGYISNHTLVSTVTGSLVNTYVYGAGWDWGTDSGVINVASSNNTRKTIIINNNSEAAKCYVLMGNSDFGTINLGEPPEKYTFLLDAGGVYFGDQSTSALEHHICVQSSSYADFGQMTVTVTQVY